MDDDDVLSDIMDCLLPVLNHLKKPSQNHSFMESVWFFLVFYTTPIHGSRVNGENYLLNFDAYVLSEQFRVSLGKLADLLAITIFVL